MAAGDPIVNLSELISLATATSREMVFFNKRQAVNNASGNTDPQPGSWVSTWMFDGNPGGTPTAPTTSAVCTNATGGAIKFVSPASGTRKRLTYWNAACDRFGGVILYDRLVHQGGLDATVTTAQTTNFPTSALTRYTTGIGVEAWAEIYTFIGATQTTYTISYTNDAGSSGQTSIAIDFGGSGTNDAQGIGHVRFTPLASGDRGVKAVASLTLAATTGTAGAFGITLAYPLAYFALGNMSDTSTTVGGAGERSFIQDAGGPLDIGINSDACLGLLYMCSATGAFDNVIGTMHFVEK